MDAPKTCEFCRREDQQGSTCSGCGAKLPEREYGDRWIVPPPEPFFYNGYIVYRFWHDDFRQSIEIQWWLGPSLIERMVIPSDLMRLHVPELVTPLSFFWDLFMLSQGYKDTVELAAKNHKQEIVQLEIRRKADPEKERRMSLTMEEIYEEIRR